MILLLLFASIIGTALGQAPAPALRVSMISLGVKDMARSIHFYGDTLGLQMIGKPDEVTLFRAGDITIVLNRPLAEASRTALAGAVEIVFPADSVSELRKHLIERGCVFTIEPHEVSPGQWASTFTDPDGHLLTLFGSR